MVQKNAEDASPHIAQSQIVAFEQFIEQFKEESDRAAVILAASKLDSILYLLLSHFLISSPTSKDAYLMGSLLPYQHSVQKYSCVIAWGLSE
jgi:hypothetical protein